MALHCRFKGTFEGSNCYEHSNKFHADGVIVTAATAIAKIFCKTFTQSASLLITLPAGDKWEIK